MKTDKYEKIVNKRISSIQQEQYKDILQSHAEMLEALKDIYSFCFDAEKNSNIRKDEVISIIGAKCIVIDKANQLLNK